MQYCFPPQPTVVDSVSLLVKELVQGASNSDRSDLPTVAGWLHENDTEEQRLAEEQRIRKRGLRTLVAVGTYSIGKERIVKGMFTFVLCVAPAKMIPDTGSLCRYSACPRF